MTKELGNHVEKTSKEAIFLYRNNVDRKYEK